MHLVAGSGLILPVDWQVLEGITVHYALGEINGISKEEDAVILSTAQGKAVAEVTVGGQRMRVEGKDGRLVMPWLRL